MNKHGIVTIFLILSTMTVVLGFYIPFVNASNETASINAANSSINQAFTNVLAAEKSGANVTQLLTKLNTAGEFLAQANNYYRGGNLANVTSNADNARSIANQVNTEAITIRNNSVARSQNSLLISLIFSFGGSLVFVVVLLLVWRRFKRSYLKKLLGLKPLGVENAT